MGKDIATMTESVSFKIIFTYSNKFGATRQLSTRWLKITLINPLGLVYVACVPIMVQPLYHTALPRLSHRNSQLISIQIQRYALG